MAIFESRKTLESKLESATADVTRLEAELAAAQPAAESVVSLTQDLAAVREDLAACQAELETETAAHTATRADLAAERLKTTPEAINKRVTAELAAAGHPPVETDPGSAPGASATPHLDKIKNLTGGARSAYYSRHEAEIKAELSR